MTTTFNRAIGALPWINKDTGATLDYQIDWGDPTDSWIGKDAIQSTIWTVDSGLTVVTNTFNRTSATVWLAGGVSGVTYGVTCRITTVAGRVDERAFQIKAVAQLT